MKNKESILLILRGIAFILIPWLYLYAVELPYYKWFWFFGMYHYGFLTYFFPLFIYVPIAILGFVIGAVTYPFYQIGLKALKRTGFGFANWNFALNIGMVIFLLITNRIALGFRSSSAMSNAPWLYILLGLIASTLLTTAIFMPILLKAKTRMVNPFKLRKLVVIGAAIFVLSLVVSASRVTSQTSQLKDNPNVLLITLDTANVNYMPGYGSPDLVAPRIANFIDNAILFENTYVSVPLTTPAHASIFTGAHPQIHKAYTNETRLPYKAHTIAEYFKSQGYVTGGFPSAFCMTAENNIDQGFDYFVNRQITGNIRTDVYRYIAPFRFIEIVTGKQLASSEMPINSNAKLTNQKFLRWLNKNQGRRWFAWVHYFDLHAPYLPPSMAEIPKAQQMGDVETSLMSASVESLTCLFGSKYWNQKNIKAENLNDDDVTYIRNLYREELKFVDEAFGEVIDNLRDKKILDNTIIVLIGDHGEGLYERGYFGHNYFLNDDEAKAPFYIYIPTSVWQNQSEEVINTLKSMGYIGHDPETGDLSTRTTIEIGWNVESIDLMPTLIDYAGLNIPSKFKHKGKNHAYGQSLRPLIEMDPEVVPNWQEPALSQIFVYSRAVRVGDWKLIWGLNKGDRFFRYNCEEYRLYDMRNDPNESNNLAETYPEKRDELIGILEEMMRSLERKRNFRSIPFEEYIKVKSDKDKELVETLTGLGYISDSDLNKMFSSDWSDDVDTGEDAYIDENCGCRGRESGDVSIQPWQVHDSDINDGV